MGGGASGEGSGAANGGGSASLLQPALAVAGSAAAAGQGMASVAPGMPVMTPDGASLGKVREVIANGRGEVEQVVVKQGKVTRTLPAGMFSASGNALIAGQASGDAGGSAAEPAPAFKLTGLPTVSRSVGGFIHWRRLLCAAASFFHIVGRLALSLRGEIPSLPGVNRCIRACRIIKGAPVVLLRRRRATGKGRMRHDD
jgi:hypothetical protein